MPIPHILIDHEEKIELRMRQIFEHHEGSNLPLYRMMQYQLGWLARDGTPDISPTPPRLYGALCMETALSFGDLGISDYAGAAIEMLVNSVIVHEEMQTAGNSPHLREAVWWVWGPAQAINVGDSLHALCRLTIFELQKLGISAELTIKAVTNTDKCSLSYYEGQFLDLSYQERLDVSEVQYERMVKAKKGSLLSSAIQLGAVLSGANESFQSSLNEFCLKLGLAIQIQNDLKELWPSNSDSISFKVMNKSKLLPVIYAFEHATLAHKKALGSIYFKRVMDPSDVSELRMILEDIGSKEYAEEKLNNTIEETNQLISSLSFDLVAKNRWEQIVKSLTADEL